MADTEVGAGVWQEERKEVIEVAGSYIIQGLEEHENDFGFTLGVRWKAIRFAQRTCESTDVQKDNPDDCIQYRVQRSEGEGKENKQNGLGF